MPDEVSAKNRLEEAIQKYWKACEQPQVYGETASATLLPEKSVIVSAMCENIFIGSADPMILALAIPEKFLMEAAIAVREIVTPRRINVIPPITIEEKE